MLGELPPRLPLVKPHILVLAGLTLAVVGAEIRYVKTDEQAAQVLLRLVPTAIEVAGGVQPVWLPAVPFTQALFASPQPLGLLQVKSYLTEVLNVMLLDSPEPKLKV